MTIQALSDMREKKCQNINDNPTNDESIGKTRTVIGRYFQCTQNRSLDQVYSTHVYMTPHHVENFRKENGASAA